MDTLCEQYNQCRVSVHIDAVNPVTKKAFFRAAIEEHVVPKRLRCQWERLYGGGFTKRLIRSCSMGSIPTGATNFNTTLHSFSWRYYDYSILGCDVIYLAETKLRGITPPENCRHSRYVLLSLSMISVSSINPISWNTSSIIYIKYYQKNKSRNSLMTAL